MIYEASQFVFQPPPPITRARRVLIKPLAPYPKPPPWTTSREILEKVIIGIRKASKADILLLESNPEGKPMRDIYKELSYDFPGVHILDVNDCFWVEIESPLPKPFGLPTAWVPNTLLACDYWISITPFRVIGGEGSFTIPNLLGLLPVAKYRWEELFGLGKEKVIADLYFILPFDLGIIDGAKRLIDDKVEEYNKVFVGEPFEVDLEASLELGLKTPYLDLIRLAKAEYGA